MLKPYTILYNVWNVPNVELFNSPSLPDKNNVVNILCAKIVHVMKHSTGEYYNMRIALGLECA